MEKYKSELFNLNDLTILCSINETAPVIIFGVQCLEYNIRCVFYILYF